MGKTKGDHKINCDLLYYNDYIQRLHLDFVSTFRTY